MSPVVTNLSSYVEVRYFSTVPEQVISNHGIQVKTFTTINKAVQWLLVQDIDEDIWNQAPVLTF